MNALGAPGPETGVQRIAEFTVRAIERALAQGDVVLVAEQSKGLALRVGRRKATWSYRTAFKGEDVRLVLGPYPNLNIVQVLGIVDDLNARVASGLDPRGSRKLVVSATLQELIDEWASTAPKQANRKKRHAQLVRNLEPLLGMPADLLSHTDIDKALRQTKVEHPTTARAVIGDLRSVYKLAITTRRVAENPAPLVRRPPRKIDDNFPDLSELGHVLGAISQLPTLDALFLRFLIMSGCRTGESRRITASDVDQEGGRVIVRAEYTKTRRELWLPLSPPLQRVLERAGDVNAATGTPIFGAISEKRKARIADFVNRHCRDRPERASNRWHRLHGLRKTMLTEGQRIGLSGDLLDAAIGHETKGGVRRAYDFYQLWPERQIVCGAWCDVVDFLENEHGKIAHKLPLEVVLRKRVQAFVKMKKKAISGDVVSG